MKFTHRPIPLALCEYLDGRDCFDFHIEYHAPPAQRHVLGVGTDTNPKGLEALLAAFKPYLRSVEKRTKRMPPGVRDWLSWTGEIKRTKMAAMLKAIRSWERTGGPL